MADRKLVVHSKREAFDILIDRSTIWGNPFSHKAGTAAKFQVPTVDDAIAEYRKWFLAHPDMVTLAKDMLRGRVLGCRCRPKDGFQGRLLCHGQVLAGIANDLDPLSFE